MSELTKVRTTMRPDEEIEVGPQELLDLKRQGLLVEDDKAAPRRAAAEKKENN